MPLLAALVFCWVLLGAPSPTHAIDGAAIQAWAAQFENWAAVGAGLGWEPGSEPCPGSAAGQWARVECGGGNVTAVDLAGLGLAGSLPPTLPQALATLSLADNQLGGGLPAAWQSSSLQQLDLSGNAQLTGSLPAAWSSQLPVMQRLSVARCPGLAGAVPQSWQQVWSPGAFQQYTWGTGVVLQPGSPGLCGTVALPAAVYNGAPLFMWDGFLLDIAAAITNTLGPCLQLPSSGATSNGSNACVASVEATNPLDAARRANVPLPDLLLAAAGSSGAVRPTTGELGNYALPCYVAGQRPTSFSGSSLAQGQWASEIMPGYIKYSKNTGDPLRGRVLTRLKGATALVLPQAEGQNLPMFSSALNQFIGPADGLNMFTRADLLGIVWFVDLRRSMLVDALILTSIKSNSNVSVYLFDGQPSGDSLVSNAQLCAAGVRVQAGNQPAAASCQGRGRFVLLVAPELILGHVEVYGPDGDAAAGNLLTILSPADESSGAAAPQWQAAASPAEAAVWLTEQSPEGSSSPTNTTDEGCRDAPLVLQPGGSPVAAAAASIGTTSVVTAVTVLLGSNATDLSVWVGNSTDSILTGAAALCAANFSATAGAAFTVPCSAAGSLVAVTASGGFQICRMSAYVAADPVFPGPTERQAAVPARSRVQLWIIFAAFAASVLLVGTITTLLLRRRRLARQEQWEQQQKHQKLLFTNIKPAAAPAGQLVAAASGVSSQSDNIYATLSLGSLSPMPSGASTEPEGALPETVVQLECNPATGEPIMLGQGHFGKVYVARLHGVQVAAKVLIEQMRYADLLQEASLLRSCRSPHIVTFLGAFQSSSGHVILVTELCRGGMLTKAVLANSVPWRGCGRHVALDVALGVHYLHSHGVLHLDIKSPNILLTEDGHAKLADVGLARMLQKGRNYLSEAPSGTLAYAAPEQLLGDRCTTAADVYSFGVVLWELITREAPSRGRMRSVRVPKECSAEVAAILERCWRVDPSERPTAAELVTWLQTEAGSSGIE